jgi:hypothetical protein
MAIFAALLLLVQAQEEEVGVGVVWKFRRSEAGPQSVGVLEVDPEKARIAFAPAKGLEKTSAIATRTRAVAAVNGGYFTREGKPLGILKVGGETLSTATGGRGAVGIDAKGGFHWKRLDEGAGWPEVADAMGGVPLLLEDGKVPDMTRERAAHLVARHPRTAIGITASKKVLLVVVDGRTPEAAGMSCAELAEHLRGLGCTWALNLDGGGSSALWVRGKPGGGIVSHPCDDRKYDAAGERAVANAVLVLAKDVVEGGEAAVDASGVARWSPRIEFDGDYELLVRRPEGAKPLRLTAAGRAAELGAASGWVSAGTFALKAGPAPVEAAGKGVDAVKWVEK